EKSQAELLYEQIKQFLKMAKDAGKDLKTCLALSPGTFFVELTWQVDLHNMLYFIRKRQRSNSPELKEYLECLLVYLKAVAPCCYSAFTEYVLKGKFLNEESVVSISNQLKLLPRNSILEEAKKTGMSPGEIQEFFNKLKLPTERS
uniref:hypothetical protein n=1 Tax=Candidatus Similichlamydia epinepheli TaxID=1903953 RepID=UPI0013005BDB